MKQLVFLITMIIGFAANAKDFSFIPYRVGDLWGYCDKAKTIIIEPKFERTYWFADNGLARVKINGKYGFIDKKGNFKIDPLFEDASDFNFEGALVTKKGKKYCLDKEGRLEKTNAKMAFDCSGLESAADDGSDICSNCCEPFEENGLIGIVCKQIDYIDGAFKTTSYDSVPAQYDTIYSSIGYSENFMPLIASRNDKLGIVDAENRLIYDFKYDSIKIISFNTFLLKQDNKWTLRDTGKILYSDITSYKSFLFYSGHYIAVKVKEKWGVLNSNGQEVIPFRFEDIILADRHIIQREFTIKMNGKWGYVSDRGNISPIYDSLEPFNGYEYTLVSKYGKEGYISRDGEEYFKN